MFDGAAAFNQNIGGWDVSNVRDMSGMFFRSGFNSNIGGWDVSNVQTMYIMFNLATRFNQDISGWDVRSLSDASLMFSGAISFRKNLCSWGDILRSGSFFGMFQLSGCPIQDQPNLSADPPGPFCFACS